MGKTKKKNLKKKFFWEISKKSPSKKTLISALEILSGEQALKASWGNSGIELNKSSINGSGKFFFNYRKQKKILNKSEWVWGN